MRRFLDWIRPGMIVVPPGLALLLLIGTLTYMEGLAFALALLGFLALILGAVGSLWLYFEIALWSTSAWPEQTPVGRLIDRYFPE